MKTQRTALVIFVAAMALALSQAGLVLAEDTPIKDAAKKAGHDAKEMGKKAGKTAKEVGKSIGSASKRTYKTIKKEFRNDFIDGKPGNSAPGNNASDRR